MALLDSCFGPLRVGHDMKSIGPIESSSILTANQTGAKINQRVNDFVERNLIRDQQHTQNDRNKPSGNRGPEYR